MGRVSPLSTPCPLNYQIFISRHMAAAVLPPVQLFCFRALLTSPPCGVLCHYNHLFLMFSSIRALISFALPADRVHSSHPRVHRVCTLPVFSYALAEMQMLQGFCRVLFGFYYSTLL